MSAPAIPTQQVPKATTTPIKNTKSAMDNQDLPPAIVSKKTAPPSATLDVNSTAVDGFNFTVHQDEYIGKRRKPAAAKIKAESDSADTALIHWEGQTARDALNVSENVVVLLILSRYVSATRYLSGSAR